MGCIFKNWLYCRAWSFLDALERSAADVLLHASIKCSWWMKDVHSNRAQSQELKSVQQYSTKLFLDIKLLAVQTSVHKGKKSFYGILIFFFLPFLWLLFIFSLSYAVVLQGHSDAFREPTAFCWEASVEAVLVAAAQSNLCFFIRTEPGALALVICNTYGK